MEYLTLIHKKTNFIYLWIVFIIFTFTVCLFIGLTKYEQSSYYVGYFLNDKVSFLIDETKITSLPKYVYLDSKSYEYNIASISDDYSLENNKRFRLVTIISNFKTDNSVADVKFVYGKTYLLKEILKIIKGG